MDKLHNNTLITDTTVASTPTHNKTNQSKHNTLYRESIAIH